MNHKLLLATFFVACCTLCSVAQQNTPNVYSFYTTEQKRAEFRSNLVYKIIYKKLEFNLTDSTEKDWVQAFWGMELIQFKSVYVENRLRKAFENFNDRSVNFKQRFLELIYTNYLPTFYNQIKKVALSEKDPTSLAIAVEYLLKNKIDSLDNSFLEKIKQQNDSLFKSNNLIAKQLLNRIDDRNKKYKPFDLYSIFYDNFLKNELLVVSLQRKNRNYPGLVLVRKPNGEFLKNENGGLFGVTQLARSITNLPYFIKNGNTPQGLYKLSGTGVSESMFLGPTTNLQLSMPFEKCENPFFEFNNDNIKEQDAFNLYKKLLPPSLKNNKELYQSFYAGQIGRSEIIAHGTTIDPEFYVGKTYYPCTPSLGCLCTKEFWDKKDGKRVYSDQQKLVNAIFKAHANAKGYLLVVEIDDQQKPVTIEEIEEYLHLQNVTN